MSTNALSAYILSIFVALSFPGLARCQVILEKSSIDNSIETVKSAIQLHKKQIDSARLSVKMHSKRSGTVSRESNVTIKKIGNDRILVETHKILPDNTQQVKCVNGVVYFKLSKRENAWVATDINYYQHDKSRLYSSLSEFDRPDNVANDIMYFGYSCYGQTLADLLDDENTIVKSVSLDDEKESSKLYERCYTTFKAAWLCSRCI